MTTLFVCQRSCSVNGVDFLKKKTYNWAETNPGNLIILIILVQTERGAMNCATTNADILKKMARLQVGSPIFPQIYCVSIGYLLFPPPNSFQILAHLQIYCIAVAFFLQERGLPRNIFTQRVAIRRSLFVGGNSDSRLKTVAIRRSRLQIPDKHKRSRFGDRSYRM